jgi:hypothetical protein
VVEAKRKELAASAGKPGGGMRGNLFYRVTVRVRDWPWRAAACAGRRMRPGGQAPSTTARVREVAGSRVGRMLACAAQAKAACAGPGLGHVSPAGRPPVQDNGAGMPHTDIPK